MNAYVLFGGQLFMLMLAASPVGDRINAAGAVGLGLMWMGAAAMYAQ